jgi:hypothetical protein
MEAQLSILPSPSDPLLALCSLFVLFAALPNMMRNRPVSVQIEAIDGHQLRLTGDVETLLDLPARAKMGRLFAGDFRRQSGPWQL